MRSQSNGIVLFLVGGSKKRDDAFLTESPESCFNGISELKRSYHFWKYTNLKIGRDKVLCKNVQRMPSASNSVGKMIYLVNLAIVSYISSKF